MHGDAYDIRCELVPARAVPACALEDRPLRVGERGVQTQRLGRVIETLGELAGASRAVRERGGALGHDAHEIFSMFTRNDLNSGVLAFESPTNGVSAFASQFRDSSG